MGKEKPGFLTAKAFSNRIKSKGLQKLRWFCQLCQKQCRDENGFKCHMMSESHHRQMLLFDENKDSVMSEYTRQFMRGYLDILKRQFGGKRTQANVVYQEYIKDKSHVHMNSTKFTTLTGFINCLQKMGLCAVDQTEKGWFIEYVAKDPEAEQRDKKKRRLEQSEMEEEEHFFDMISKKKKIELEDNFKTDFSELIKGEDEKIVLSFFKTDVSTVGCSSVNNNNREIESSRKKNYSWDDVEGSDLDNNNNNDKKRDLKEDSIKKTPRKLTVLEEIKLEQEKMKERFNRKNYWLHEGIVVKLIDEHLPKSLLKKEVHVKQLEDRYTAIVRTVDLEGGNKKMKVKQNHVMTVVPPVGGRVLLVNGGYRGYKGKLLSVDKKKFIAEVELDSGIYSGMKLTDVSFDDISKLFDQTE